LVDLDKDKIKVDKEITVQDMLNKNTDIILRIQNDLNNNLQQLQLIGDNLTDIRNQGINVNPQFNVLIQQYITRINEVQEEINRNTARTSGQSAILTSQVLQRLRETAETNDRNTRALIEAISRTGSLAGTSSYGGQQLRRSPLSSPDASPEHDPFADQTNFMGK
jgi:hypothetical protein